MLGEFKEFIARGNVIDLAVGVIIGGAFGKIVTSLTEDLIMPPLGLVLGKVDFNSLFVSLNGEYYPTLAKAREAGAPVLALGSFLNQCVNFVLIAFCVFLLVKAVNRFKRQRQAPPVPAPTTRECPECLSAIPQMARRCAHCTAAVEPAA